MLFVMLIEVIYGFGTMFTACELCQWVNLAFDDCNDIINQFKWYLMPIEMQRMLPSILQFAQQPVEIKCFGTTACDRETFKFVSTSKAHKFRSLHICDAN